MSPTKNDWLSVEIEHRPEVLLDVLADNFSVSDDITQLMQLTAKPDAPIKPIVETLSRSPQLAAEVLKVANSPVYSPAQAVLDLKRAVVLIGLQELHTMAAGLSMMAMFSTDNPIGAQLSNTSVVSATIARQLATQIPLLVPNTAFVCGLLCEVGALACNELDRDGYLTIWNNSRQLPGDRVPLERERFGVSTEFIGGKLLAKNGLPTTITNAISRSFDEARETDDLLSKITCFARFAAYILVDAGAENNFEIVRTQIPTLADNLGLLGFDANKLIALCVEAGRQANLGLQGKAELYMEDPPPAAPSTTIESSPAPSVSGTPANRPSKTQSTPLLLIALVVTGLVITGVVLWKLFT